jgi:hypothetical protein
MVHGTSRSLHFKDILEMNEQVTSACQSSALLTNSNASQLNAMPSSYPLESSYFVENLTTYFGKGTITLAVSSRRHGYIFVLSIQIISPHNLIVSYWVIATWLLP